MSPCSLGSSRPPERGVAFTGILPTMPTRNRLSVNASSRPASAEVPVSDNGLYSDGCVIDLKRGREQVGSHQHEVLFCPVALRVTPTPPTCTLRGANGYVCANNAQEDPAAETPTADQVVPAGSYFLVGDNRADGDDSRTYGPVPEQDVIGKAVVIWASGELQRRRGMIWERTFTLIQ